MEEEAQSKKSWLIWIIIVPVCMVIGMLLTKWVLQPGKAGRAAPAEETAAAALPAAPEASKPAAADSAGYDLPGDEPAGGEAGIIWANKPGASSPSGKPAAAGAPAAEAAVDPKEAKKYRGMGLAYGVLTKAVEKIIGSPKAVNALLSNDYVVKGFMSRDTVKDATRNSASLANYLKNPANLNKFMAKEAVQRGMNDQEFVNAVATSKLVGALMDTPGGQALLKDPAAMAGILQANPGLVDVLRNPAILNALVNNPKAAGVVSSIAMPGMPL